VSDLERAVTLVAHAERAFDRADTPAHMRQTLERLCDLTDAVDAILQKTESHVSRWREPSDSPDPLDDVLLHLTLCRDGTRLTRYMLGASAWDLRRVVDDDPPPAAPPAAMSAEQSPSRVQVA
jgi:hypothetical protein